MTAIASLALGQTLLAQRQTRTPPQGTRKVLIFKSKGVSRPSEDDRSSAPPNLSVALKKEMLKEQGPQKLLIFKSKGVSRTSEEDGSSAPPDLSVALKKEMLKELNLSPGPGSVYIKLTPRNSYVAGKGFLYFRNPIVVTGKDDNAAWGPPLNDTEKFVEISLKSEAAGRRYLIDCAVNQTAGSNFKIWKGYNDLLQTIESAGAPGQHLVFLLDATDNGWHMFKISGGAGWYFYSCEVTNL